MIGNALIASATSMHVRLLSTHITHQMSGCAASVLFNVSFLSLLNVHALKMWQINHSTFKQQNICFPNSFLSGFANSAPSDRLANNYPKYFHALSRSSFPPCFHLICFLLSLHFSPRPPARSLFPLPLAQTSAVLLLMSLTGGNLHPYMFSLQLHHGSSVLPNISVLCWWSPLWGVLPASLHYIFPLFRFSQRGLCHLAVLGPKCYLTPDNKSSRRLCNNIISELFPVGASLKLVL